MLNFPLPRLDKDQTLKTSLLKYCRLKKGEIWKDPLGKHKVGCFDVLDRTMIGKLINRRRAALAIQDPPYNMVLFGRRDGNEFADWCREWIKITYQYVKDDASLYIWLGADQKNNFQPFAEFIMMMKESGFLSKSFITMRNQRGYGTQKNWMSVRQELLYYIKGNPVFNANAVYTDIPKAVKGYYKIIGGTLTENLERSKSLTIRAGNVWLDVQQVFHLMEENINGCFAQKPLKAMERIISVSSRENDNVIDFFAHAGTTLLACERLHRRCATLDIDPIYCEISIRRLERYRKTGKLGWQNSNPFEVEIMTDSKIRNYLKKEYRTHVPDLLN